MRKEFSFAPTNYVVTFSATATDGPRALQPAIAWGPGLGDAGALAAGGSFFTGNYTQPPEAIFHRDGERRTRARRQARGRGLTQKADSDLRASTITTSSLPSIDPGQARLEYRAADSPRSGRPPSDNCSRTRFDPAQPIQGVRFFVGPKQFDALQPVDPEFTKAINFGMFRVLSVPLLNALKWVHGYVGNWGWSIIVLTILINLAIAPLRHKSVVSMRKMQALQPQLKAIQDHYAGLKVTDPAKQKMNTEIMNLYREKGVNPASGCVPMLLTMPILFAFYSLLSQAIELRGAEFGAVDHGSVGARSVLRHSGANGADDVLAAANHAIDCRSGAAEDHDDDAAHVRRHVLVGPERPGLVLVCRKPVGHRPAVLHKLDDRAASVVDCAPTSRTSHEERRSRPHRRRGTQELTVDEDAA